MLDLWFIWQTLFVISSQLSCCIEVGLFSDLIMHQWLIQDFFGEGVQQIQLRTEGREDGDLWAVASKQCEIYLLHILKYSLYYFTKLLLSTDALSGCVT
jgi:hypothetical protein